MTWSNYVFHGLPQINDLDNRVQATIRVQNDARRSLVKRVAELETDLGSVALLARALSDVCVKKGLHTREEIAAGASHLDAGDGKADGKLSRKRV